MTSDFSRVETVIAGLFVALLSALDFDAAGRAIDTLCAFVEDKRTGEYERKFYADLVESIEPALPAGGLYESLTLQ